MHVIDGWSTKKKILDNGAEKEGQQKKQKKAPDFSKIQTAADYGPNGGGSGQSGSFAEGGSDPSEEISLWDRAKKTGQAMAGGAARSGHWGG